MDQLDSSFYNPHNVPAYLGLPNVTTQEYIPANIPVIGGHIIPVRGPGPTAPGGIRRVLWDVSTMCIRRKDLRHVFSCIAFAALMLSSATAAPPGLLPEEVDSKYSRLKYSRLLLDAHEPSLFSNISGADGEEYRFIWLRTFHNPIVIRLRRTVDGGTLRMIRWDGRGGYEFGRIDVDRTVLVRRADWNEFVAAIAQCDFWNMKSTEVPSEPMFDGARWLLEGRKAGLYHFVERLSPLTDERLKSYARACQDLINLAKVLVPEAEVY
jgi:hypothetical protein